MGIAKENRLGFHELCVMYKLKYPSVLEMSIRAGVAGNVLNDMLIGSAVHRASALKILSALSDRTGRVWTLGNVNVTLFPTFSDLYKRQKFDLSQLSTGSGVPRDVINAMLEDRPVSLRDARLVLQMVSRLTGQNASLDTVDVKTTEAELPDCSPPLLQLWNQHNLGFLAFAVLANISVDTLKDLLCDTPVDALEAERVLQAVSRLTGEEHTLENVDLLLTCPVKDELYADIACFLQQENRQEESPD